LSKEAIFNPPKAIRGGIPICFPQFSDMGPCSSHGFARNCCWTVVSVEGNRALMSFTPGTDQLGSYAQPFQLLMEVEVTENALKSVLTVKNTGGGVMEFTTALHTYLRVSDIGRVTVNGLGGLEYLDNANGRARCKDGDGSVRFAGEVDRIYLGAPDEIEVAEEGVGCFTVCKSNLPDAVVWNPWAEKAAATGDFGDEEYREMVCVEPASAGSGCVALEAGGSWSCAQKILWRAA